MIVHALRRLGGSIGEMILPGVCVACRAEPAERGGLGESCRKDLLSLLALPYCLRCGATIGPHVTATYDDGCSQCPSPLPRFGQVLRLGPHELPLSRAVHAMKFRGRAEVLTPLADLLAKAIANDEAVADIEVIVPVPMHWRRRLARPSDLATLLAERLGRALALPVSPAVRRVRHTRPQVRLSRTQRIENVRGAFALRWADDIAGAKVLLVDDVTTTGATASEVARVLCGGGAVSVHLAVLTKAEKNHNTVRLWFPSSP
jgi:competence protein ComFC